MGDDGMIRVFVPHGCGSCVYQLTAFPERQTGEREYDGGEIFLSVLSDHVQLDAHRWRNRVKRAWRALRGRTDWGSELSFETVGDLDAVIAALRELRPKVWPRGW